ncbi:cytospin-A-like isoform X3 [Styela clava]|uniref:cytospin-A-like isoform X3 n=1 Tax=Styela clava TaxID=7725 RepID=UPI00193A8888|nr:cytospin-A-like isoform X3 [Styela clava]
MSSTRKTGKSVGSNGSSSTSKTTGTKVPMRAMGNGTNSQSSSLYQSKSKTQSQEDLTKAKDRASSRPKYSSGTPSSSYNSTRRPATSKEGQKSSVDRLSRDKNRPSTASSTVSKTSSSSTTSARSTAASQRRKDSASISRVKPDDKSTLEAKIKDLMATAKGKDSEIKLLREKVESMSQIIEQKQSGAESNDEATSNSTESPEPGAPLSPLSNTNSTESPNTEEVQSLKDENLKLREQLDAMMLSMRQKTDTEKSLMLLHRQAAKHNMHGADTDASSHDGDALGSSMEDLASASVFPVSRGTSQFGSSENLLEVGSNCDTHSSRADDKLPPSSDGSENSSAAAVVCLTEKIHRMEESQISTNEELEATVQELADLQKSVPELTTDNTRLRQEKQYLMQKLCETEKRLDQKESEVQHLRVILNDRLRDDPDKPSVEQQYMQLLDEREHLLDVQDETNARLRSTEQKVKETHVLATALEEQNRKLEREMASLTAERNRLEKTIQDFRESGSDRKHSVTIQHLEDCLHQERDRVSELIKKQAVMAAGDAGSSEELVTLLEQLRNEKHDIEEKYILAEEEAGQLKEENEKLDDKVAELEEEIEAASAKTKKDLSELSEVIDHLQEEIRLRVVDLENAKETIFLMEDAVEQNMAVKKHDNHMISKLQAQISTLKEEKFRLGKEIHQLKKEQKTQSEEWKQFQADLQMAVMIANDMKAETQAEVARLREENQMLDERITKLQVENEQLRRRRKTTSSINFPDPDRRQRSVEKELAALRESWGVTRRYGEQHSPGVQSLIKSFDNHIMQVSEQQQQKTSPPGSPGSPTTPEPRTKKAAMSSADQPGPFPASQSNSFPPSQKFSPSKSLVNLGSAQKTAQSNGATNSPVMAEVAPMQRHHSMSSIQQDPQTVLSKMGNVQHSSKPGTPDGKRTSSNADLSQLSSLLLARGEKRTSSNPDSRKQSFESRKPLAGGLDLRLDRLSPSNAPSSPTPSVTGSAATAEGRDSPIHPAASTPPVQIRRRVMSTPGGDSLATLARRYGGSKRNALLKWCQEKTKGYAGIDITNFSSSWNDGLAFCALVHSHLPAHIPYDTLHQQLVNATDMKTVNMLQAKNFRLAFAAAESVGIEPSLTVEEVTNTDRPDWQRVMRYVTEIYKYFEM